MSGSEARGRRAVSAWLLLVVAASVGGCHVRPRAHVGPLVTQRQAVGADGAVSADVELTFYSGKFELTGGGDELLAIDSQDNLEEFTAALDSQRQEGHLDVRAWVQSEARLDTWEDDATIHEWKVQLGKQVPVGLALELAMFHGAIDLGGVPVQRLTATLGLCDGKLDFSRRNPIAMERCELKLGAGEFDVLRLGNARCASSSFEVSSGHFVIDLAGEWERPGLVRIEGGACDVEVRIPRGLSVRIDGRQVQFADLDVSGIPETGDREFADALPAGAAPKLVLELAVQFGNVTITRD